MTARPDLALVAAAALDSRQRLRPEAARMAPVKIRCDRERHLQGFILRTAAGLAVVWRPADMARTARDVWAEEWLDLAPEVIRVTCNCRVNRAVDLTAYRSQLR
jgi:hypothetical protein